MCPRSLDIGRGLVAWHPPHPLIAGGRLVGSRARPRRKALTPAPGAMALWHGKQGDWRTGTRRMRIYLAFRDYGERWHKPELDANAGRSESKGRTFESCRVHQFLRSAYKNGTQH